MAFNKNIKTIFFFVTVCIITNIIYDNYITIGKDTVIMGLDNVCGKKSSVYKYESPTRKVVIVDKYGFINRLHINKESFRSNIKVMCSENQKFFLIKDSFGLKSDSDSIGISAQMDKLHGYMGVFLKNDCYYVDKNGKINTCDQNIDIQNYQ